MCVRDEIVINQDIFRQIREHGLARSTELVEELCRILVYNQDQLNKSHKYKANVVM